MVMNAVDMTFRSATSKSPEEYCDDFDSVLTNTYISEANAPGAPGGTASIEAAIGAADACSTKRENPASS